MSSSETENEWGILQISDLKYKTAYNLRKMFQHWPYYITPRKFSAQPLGTDAFKKETKLKIKQSANIGRFYNSRKYQISATFTWIAMFWISIHNYIRNFFHYFCN